MARIVVIALLSGCSMTAAAADRAPQPAWIASNESIVVLESPQFYFDWDHRKLPTRVDLFHCATQAVHTKYPRVRLVSQSEFSKLAFPDLEPGAAPVSPDSLKLLLDNPRFQQRISQLHVRYLVYGGTSNDIETVTEGFGCIGGVSAAICGGGAKWNKRSDYHALIIDLKTRQESSANQSFSGTSWWVAVVPLFVAGRRAPTESRACQSIGGDVLALLDKDQVAQSPAVRGDPR